MQIIPRLCKKSSSRLVHTNHTHTNAAAAGYNRCLQHETETSAAVSHYVPPRHSYMLGIHASTYCIYMHGIETELIRNVNCMACTPKTVLRRVNAVGCRHLTFDAVVELEALVVDGAVRAEANHQTMRCRAVVR